MGLTWDAAAGTCYGDLGIGVFLPEKEAKFLQHRKVLFRFCEVAGHQIHHSNVLFGTPTVGVVRERPLGVRKGRVEIVAIALGETQLILDLRIRRIAFALSRAALWPRTSSWALHLLRAVEAGIGRRCVHPAAASTVGATQAEQLKNKIGYENDHKCISMCFHGVHPGCCRRGSEYRIYTLLNISISFPCASRRTHRACHNCSPEKLKARQLRGISCEAGGPRCGDRRQKSGRRTVDIWLRMFACTQPTGSRMSLIKDFRSDSSRPAGMHKEGRTGPVLALDFFCGRAIVK
jgi:hypothetical protein